MKKMVITHSPEETQALAEQLLRELNNKHIVTLSGDLGAGKTTFTQAIGKALGIQQRIMSPTFIIMRSYQLGGTWKGLYHVDLYRLYDEKEIIDIGLVDIMKDPANLVIIEWSEKMGTLLPTDRVHIHLLQRDEQTREITISYEQ